MIARVFRAFLIREPNHEAPDCFMPGGWFGQVDDSFGRFHCTRLIQGDIGAKNNAVQGAFSHLIAYNKELYAVGPPGATLSGGRFQAARQRNPVRAGVRWALYAEFPRRSGAPIGGWVVGARGATAAAGGDGRPGRPCVPIVRVVHDAIPGSRAAQLSTCSTILISGGQGDGVAWGGSHAGRNGFTTASIVAGGRSDRSMCAEARQLATIASQRDRLRREAAAADRSLWRAEMRVLADDASLIREWCDQAASIVHRAIEAAGYHRHDRGPWRKRRMTENSEIVAVPAAASGASTAPFRFLDMAVAAERAWLRRICPDAPAAQDAVANQMRTLRTELEGPNPSPPERLLAERVALCWLQLQALEAMCGLALAIRQRWAPRVQRQPGPSPPPLPSSDQDPGTGSPAAAPGDPGERGHAWRPTGERGPARPGPPPTQPRRRVYRRGSPMTCRTSAEGVASTSSGTAGPRPPRARPGRPPRPVTNPGPRPTIATSGPGRPPVTTSGPRSVAPRPRRRPIVR